MLLSAVVDTAENNPEDTDWPETSSHQLLCMHSCEITTGMVNNCSTEKIYTGAWCIQGNIIAMSFYCPLETPPLVFKISSVLFCANCTVVGCVIWMCTAFFIQCNVLSHCWFFFFSVVKSQGQHKDCLKIKNQFWIDSRVHFFKFQWQSDPFLLNQKLHLTTKEKGICTELFTSVILLLYITNNQNIYT